MDDIIFACNATNKFTSGNYDYFLFSRYDNYAVIMRSKTDNTEWLFRVILDDENVTDIWGGDVTALDYIRPDQAHTALKRYIINKLRAFNSARGSDAEKWV